MCDVVTESSIETAVEPGRAGQAASSRDLKQTVARNVVWNWAGVAVEAVVGFVVAPFLIRSLGDTTYGLWILIGALTSYFGMLEFGLRGSVGRYIAYYRAQGDADGVRATISTAAATLCGIGSLALAGVLAASWAFPYLVHVPPAEVSSVRLALAIVGVQLALFFVLQLFDASLWACQRFDILNAIDIPIMLLRGGLTLCFVAAGNGLVALALITLATTVLQGALKWWFARRHDRDLRFSRRHVRRTTLNVLFGYGVWVFIVNIAGMARSKLSPFVVGGLLGVALVTPFSLAGRLVSMAMMFLVAATGVLTPLATSLHAKQDAARQRRIFLEATRCCAVLALTAVTCFALLGKPLLTLWIGPKYAGVWPLLMILAAGELLPMTAEAGRSLVLGMARHRAFAWLSIVESALALGGGVLAARWYGITGVCVALAVSAAFCRGLYVLRYSQRQVGVPGWSFLVATIFRPLLAWVLPAAVLAAVVAWQTPDSWLTLILIGAGYTISQLGSFVIVHRLLAITRRKDILAVGPAA